MILIVLFTASMAIDHTAKIKNVLDELTYLFLAEIYKKIDFNPQKKKKS